MRLWKKESLISVNSENSSLHDKTGYEMPKGLKFKVERFAGIKAAKKPLKFLFHTIRHIINQPNLNLSAKNVKLFLCEP